MRTSGLETFSHIELGFDFGVIVDPSGDDDPEDSYHRMMRGDISLVSWNAEGDDTTEKIGYIEVWYIEGSRAYDNGLDIVDVCDSADQELYEYARAVYVDGFLDEAFRWNTFSNDVLVLHRIEMDKRFRGKGYGLIVSKGLCRRIGYECGAIIMKPAPLQFSRIGEEPEWQERYDTSGFSSDEQAATARLTEYWSGLGLHKTNDPTIYCICPE